MRHLTSSEQTFLAGTRAQLRPLCAFDFTLDPFATAATAMDSPHALTGQRLTLDAQDGKISLDEMMKQMASNVADESDAYAPRLVETLQGLLSVLKK